MRTATAWVPLAFIAGAALLGGCSDATASSDPSPSSSVALALGSCVRMVQAVDLEGNPASTSLETADCADNHHGEVVLADEGFFAPFDQMPADADLVAKSEAACAQAMYDYTGRKLEETSFRMSYLYPTTDTWDSGDRKLTCVAMAYDEEFGSLAEGTGSIHQAG